MIRNSYKLISEQYDVVLLKESAPEMTITSLHNKIQYMNLSEAEWTAQFAEKVLNEFFPAGLSAVGKAIGKGAGKAIGKGAKGAGNAIGKRAKGAKDAIVRKSGEAKDALSDKASEVIDSAKEVGGAAKERVGNMADDMKDIYKNANYARDLESAKADAEEYVVKLADLLDLAQQQGSGIDIGRDVMEIPLGDIVDTLSKGKVGSDVNTRAASKRLGKFGKRDDDDDFQLKSSPIRY